MLQSISDVYFVSLTLTIDGNILGTYSLETLYLYRLGKEATFPFTLLYLDRDLFTAIVGFLPGFYCGTEYKLDIFNGAVNDLDVIGRLAYSDVT